MARKFNFTVNGNNVKVTRNLRKIYVDINGLPYTTFNLSGESSLLAVQEDYPIKINGEKYILAIRGYKTRIAYNGRYLDNNEEFKPKVKLPKWSWIFFALNILIPIISIGGIINVCFALVGIGICTFVIRSERIPTPVRIIICTATTIVIWLVWILYMLIYITSI